MEALHHSALTGNSSPAVATYEDALAALLTHMQRDPDPFVRAVSEHIRSTAAEHTSWAAQCSVPHWDEAVPCVEFERAFLMAVTWSLTREVAA